MQTIQIISSCKVLGVDRFPGASVTVPAAIAANLLALNRAVLVVAEPEHRDEEPAHRDYVIDPPRRGRPTKSQ